MHSPPSSIIEDRSEFSSQPIRFSLPLCLYLRPYPPDGSRWHYSCLPLASVQVSLPDQISRPAHSIRFAVSPYGAYGQPAVTAVNTGQGKERADHLWAKCCKTSHAPTDPPPSQQGPDNKTTPGKIRVVLKVVAPVLDRVLIYALDLSQSVQQVFLNIGNILNTH